jgi:hypothetical protein
MTYKSELVQQNLELSRKLNGALNKIEEQNKLISNLQQKDSDKNNKILLGALNKIEEQTNLINLQKKTIQKYTEYNLKLKEQNTELEKNQEMLLDINDKYQNNFNKLKDTIKAKKQQIEENNNCIFGQSHEIKINKFITSKEKIFCC